MWLWSRALPAVKDHLPGDVVTVLVVRGTDEREESLAVEVATVHRAYPLRSVRFSARLSLLPACSDRFLVSRVAKLIDVRVCSASGPLLCRARC